MKKRILSMALALSMCLTMVPTGAFALEAPESADSDETAICVCETKCAEGEGNTDCPVCSAEGTDLTLCIGAKQEEEPAVEEPAAEEPVVKAPAVDVAVTTVQAQLDALPTVEELSTMDEQVKSAVYSALQTAHENYEALSAEKQELLNGTERFETLFDWFNNQISTLEDGSTTKSDTSVASVVINGTATYYDLIDDAWNAAVEAESASTITLLKSCTADATLLRMMEAAANITLALGDYTLSCTSITMSDGNLTITGGENGGITSKISHNGGTLNISGGNFNSSGNTVTCGKGTLTISGGNFQSTGELYSGLKVSNGTCTLTGGTFDGIDNTITEVGTLLGSGYAYYNADGALVDTSHLTEISETVTVDKTQAIVASVTVNGTTAKYVDFSKALTAAQNADTASIQLLAAASSDDFTVASGKNLSIDLNGKALDCSKITVENGGTLNMSDSSGNNSGKLNGAIFTDGELNISGGTYLYAGEANYTSMGYRVTILATANSTGTISGGVFKRNGDGNYYVSLEYVGSAKLSLTGGTFDMIDNMNQNTADKLAAGYCFKNADGVSQTYPWDQRVWNVTVAKCDAHSYSVGLCSYCKTKDPNYIGLASVTINGTTKNYFDLSEAFNDANGNTATIMMLEEVNSYNSGLSLTNGTILLDLNGKKIASDSGFNPLLTVSGADVTIQNGTLKHGDRASTINVTSGTLLLQSTVTIASMVNYNYGLSMTGGTATIDGTSFEEGYLSAGLDGGSLIINNGTFAGEVRVFGGNLQCKGGSFTDTINTEFTGTYMGIQIMESCSQTLADLLAEGYAFRSKAEGKAWISEVSGKELSNMTVEKVPVKITTQPQNKTIYYSYTNETISVAAATVPADSGKAITYQWYSVGTGTEGADEAVADSTTNTLTIPQGKTTGAYRYYCKVTCDGYELKTNTVTVTIAKSATAFEGGVKADKNSYTYGEIITVTAKPKATATAPQMRLRMFSPPTANQMALFEGDTQISDAVSVGADGVYTMTYNTANKDLSIGANTITAKYVGNNNMVDYSDTVIVTLSEKAIASATVTAGANKVYDGTNSFTGVALTLNNDVVSGDTVTATADGTVPDSNVGAGKAFIATSVALDGTHAEYYSLAASAVTGNVDIRKADVRNIADIAQSIRFNDTAEKDVSLAGKMPIDAGALSYTISTKTDTNNIIETFSVDTNGTAKFTLKSGLTFASQRAILPVTISSTNYKDSTVKIVITLTDKDIQDISYSIGAIGKTYGDAKFTNALTKTVVNGALSYASDDKSVFTVDASTGEVTIVGAGTATITATAAETDTHAEAIASYTVTVAKKAVVAKPNSFSIKSNQVIPTLTWSIEGLVGSDAIEATNKDSVALEVQENGVKLNAVKVGTFDIVFTTAPAFDEQKNYTVATGKGVLTVTKYTSGGGSSSDDDSTGDSSDNSTTTSPITTENPKPATEVTTTVKPTVSGGTATVNVSNDTINSAIQKAQDTAKKNGTTANGIVVEIKVDIKNTTASNLTANLPKASIDALVKANAKELRITSGMVDIDLNLDTLKEIQKQMNADVSVTAKKVNSNTLSADAKKIVGNRPVFDFTITGANGKKITDFGKGKVSVSIPYTLGTNEIAANVVAYYIDDAGKAIEMPNSVYDPSTKTLNFVTSHFSKFAVGYKNVAVSFTDTANHWAKDSIEFVAARGILIGTGDNKFSPNTAITRGMFVMALGRLAGADVSHYTKSSFTDVKSDANYMGYVEWVTKNGIVNEVGSGKFAPDQSITREQMAVIMQNYAKAIGFTLPKVHTENVFADQSKISSFAKDSVKTMQMAGILSGKNGNTFDPQGTATRAEVSAVLKRFVELLISIDNAEGWTVNDSGKWMYYKNGKALIGKQTIGNISYDFNQYGEITTSSSLTFDSYIVQKGDSYWSIAQKYRCSMFKLAKINNKTIFSILKPGDLLKIPESK